jgi:DNA-binding MarR family transcriptional regulator
MPDVTYQHCPTPQTTLAFDQLEQFAAACNAIYFAMRRNRGRTESGGDTETVTESQATLLEPLAVRGAMPVGALAAHVDLAQPTVTRALKTLERAGIVVRNRRTSDERTVLVELTPHGHDVLEEHPSAAARPAVRGVGTLPDPAPRPGHSGAHRPGPRNQGDQRALNRTP